jgi:putative endopeptidase
MSATAIFSIRFSKTPPRTPAPRGSSEQKIGDYYGSCMDTAKIDSEGLKPLQPELDRIQQIADVIRLGG